jgi:hypothetical protein
MTEEQQRRARAKYYRANRYIWERQTLRRKLARGFTPKIDWTDPAAVRAYDRERNRAYRKAHPNWTAAKCKRWRAKVAKEKAVEIGPHVGRCPCAVGLPKKGLRPTETLGRDP